MDANVKTLYGSGRNICPECNEQFTLKATLKAHLLSRHKFSKGQTQDLYPKLSDKIVCSEPQTSFSPSFNSRPESVYNADTYYSGDFNDTFSTAYQSLNGNVDPTPISFDSCYQWRCDECGKLFDALNKLEQHQEAKNHTGKSTSTDIETSGYETDATIIPTDTSFKCQLCVKSFDAKWKWNQHNESEGHKQRLKAIKPGNDSAIEIDEWRFTEDETSGYESDKLLVAPVIASTEKCMFYCHACSKSFDVQSRFIQHNNSEGHKQKLRMGSEMEKKTEMYPCNLDDCGRKFDNEVKLLQHQGMKHGIKVGVVETEANESETFEFRCLEEDCDKVFPTKARLLQHVRDKHPANKNDSATVRKLCQYCDEFNETAASKPFIFLTFVAKHILTAHEKAGYIKGTCPICQVRVEKQKNLLTHISRAHLFNRFKEEACFICLRLCKDKDDLLQHSTSVHRFKCTIDSCHSMFPSKPLRDKHMLDKHSVYGCGMESCQRIFPTLEEKIEHMKTPHKGEAAEPAIACLRSLANVHEGGAMSEPSAFRPVREESPAHHVRNSADESFMRVTDESVSDLLAIHRQFEEKMEDLSAFVTQFSSHLSRATNQNRSEMTFRKCEELRYAIEGIQRRLTPRVD